MMKILAIVLCLMWSASWVWAQNDDIAARDARLIRQVKQISVSELDPALPAVTFEKFLSVEASADAAFHWEVNDCGEQTGTAADRGRDFPLCVEVEAVMKDQRTITVSVAVGTLKKKAVGKPTVSFVQLATPDKTINLEHLSDIPAALIRTHGVAVPREIAK